MPMARLRTLLEEQTDLTRVSTYIASGNVFCEPVADPISVCARVRELIAHEFSVDTPVIHRTREDLVTALKAQPFSDGDEKLVHAMFLEGAPHSGAVDALTPRLVEGERIALLGSDLWISYATGGVHSTRLTKSVLDRALGVAGTARNLRTVRKLAELMA